MRIAGRLFGDRRGGVAVMAALMIFPLTAFAGFAVDMGSVYLQARQLQGIADLAAIGAADNLTNAPAAAAATANANGWAGPIQSAVVLGVYTPSAAVAAASRFSPGAATPNAAQVTLTAQANLYFGALLLGKSTVTISRVATAASAEMTSFSLGSGLLAVQGGIANVLLGALTGSQVQLSVMDYNALVSANIDLLQYSQALQTKLNLTGASFNQVLSNQMTTSQSLTVLASLLDTGGNDPAAQAVNKIAAAAALGTNTPIQLQNLISLGPYGDQDHANPATGAGISLNALDLASGILQLAQGGRQVQLALSGTVPGLTSVTAWLAIGQRPSNSPWVAVTDDDTVVITTAQTRLYIDAKVAPGAGVLSADGVSLIDVPVFVQAASAQAKLSSLACPSSLASPAVTVLVQPSIGEIALGQVNTSSLNNFQQPVTLAPATLVGLPPLSVTGRSLVNIGGLDWQSVSFSENDISSGVVKSVATNDIAQASVASLFGNLSLTVQLLGLEIGLNNTGVSSAVQSVLTTAAPSLDLVVNATSNVLGVQLGQADVSVNGIRCNNSALVS